MDVLYKYAYDVVAEKIDVSKETKAACLRSINDLKASESEDYPYYFDPTDGLRFIKFAAHFRHLEGTKAGEPFILMPWQAWVFGQILGWKEKGTNNRRFRVAHIEVPRGNGKSFMNSVFCLYALSLDKMKGPQVYCCATSQKQARIIFDKARDMCENEPNKFIKKFLGLHVRTHDIELKKKLNGFTNRGVFRPLCADPTRLDGLNISTVVIDELHEMKNSHIWDKLISGAGKRPSTLVIAITTAGFDMGTVGYEKSMYCSKVLKGEVIDDTFFGCIWKADATDNMYCVETLKKANPCWDDMNDHGLLMSSMSKAEVVPSERNAYLTLHLNQWVANGDSWLDLDKLRKCKTVLDIKEFVNEPCYIGLDMARVSDMASVVQCFYKDDKLYLFPHYFLPEDTINARLKNPLYKDWLDNGWIHSIPGPVIDPEYVRKFIEDLCMTYDVQIIAADPALQEGVAIPLYNAGWPIRNCPQAWKLSKPAKALQSMILTGNIRYENPIFEWNCGNCHIKTDTRENIYVSKDYTSSPRLIDGVIATIMALYKLIPDQYEGSCVSSWQVD
ncbi:terminase large subunit [Novacetimonas hansenii]|uniref:Terminase n=1 Tax=Novacetimonas hansenii TaxID=436 RepID=A0ABQ0SH54_NOVHA|nr:terminase TerL endonuclease subunit [Novacetimonas hansenii]GAN84013.1 hypothetical protein Gaha_0122_013 [Novacetimonas hansenii JCM 7643]GBQ55755.1 terminase [Novacetimonas hansenii NRIC 0243]GEC64593.1 terminase [Novacetimonas hansenii]